MFSTKLNILEVCLATCFKLQELGGGTGTPSNVKEFVLNCCCYVFALLLTFKVCYSTFCWPFYQFQLHLASENITKTLEISLFSETEMGKVFQKQTDHNNKI